MKWDIIIRMTLFFAAVTNRDYLKIDGKLYDFGDLLDVQPDGWLISLQYMRKIHPKRGIKIFDCGAWTYRDKEYPEVNGERLTPQKASDMYSSVASPVDFAVAPDHMHLKDMDADVWALRKKNNFVAAEEFINLSGGYVPMGVVHEEDDDSAIEYALRLVSIGYRHLSIGGLAAMARSRKKVVSRVRHIVSEMPSGIWIHALGVTAPYFIEQWHTIPISSFDGSSYFYKALTAGHFLVVSGYDFDRLDIKKDVLPSCDCRACTTVTDLGYDTQKYGNSVNNLGRAAHNLNMYIKLNGLWKKKKLP